MCKFFFVDGVGQVVYSVPSVKDFGDVIRVDDKSPTFLVPVPFFGGLCAVSGCGAPGARGFPHAFAKWLVYVRINQGVSKFNPSM